MKPAHAVTVLVLAIGLAAGGRVLLAGGFEPPGPEKRRAAIGDTKTLPAEQRRAFDPSASFDPIPAPGPSDWLANFEEPGQTFDEFVASAHNVPDERRKKIYLQPLGTFDPEKGEGPSLETLKELTAIHYGLEVVVLPAKALDEGITSRTNRGTKKKQILTSDILALVKEQLPEDAFCLLAITMTDLYPEPSWNFVFGEASLRDRVGVYSFARYDPAFFGEERGKGYETLVLRRSLKVLVHETAHMFGMHHCVYFHCVVNGSNHLAECDASPLHLCPVCLRKLHASTGVSSVARYRKLLVAYRELHLDEEARWVEKRLELVAGGSD